MEYGHRDYLRTVLNTEAMGLSPAELTDPHSVWGPLRTAQRTWWRDGSAGAARWSPSPRSRTIHSIANPFSCALRHKTGYRPLHHMWRRRAPER